MTKKEKETPAPPGIPPGYKWENGAIVPIAGLPGAPAPVPPNPMFTPNPFLPPGAGPAVPGGAAPMAGPVMATDFEMQMYLKGSDVEAARLTTVTVRAVQFVRLPQSRSPLVLQIDPVLGKYYLPLNKTNIKQLAGLLGNPDLQGVIGKTITLMVYPVNNPSSNQMSRGLFISKVE